MLRLTAICVTWAVKPWAASTAMCNGADAKPHGRVGDQRCIHNGRQIALAAADENSIRGGPIYQHFGGLACGQMQVFGMEFSAVPADQLAGIGITLNGVDLARRGGQRHLHADAAGARAHVPQDVAGTHGQFGQYGGADLLLGHRRFAADEGFVRQAGYAALQGRARFHQQHT